MRVSEGEVHVAWRPNVPGRVRQTTSPRRYPWETCTGQSQQHLNSRPLPPPLYTVHRAIAQALSRPREDTATVPTTHPRPCFPTPSGAPGRVWLPRRSRCATAAPDSAGCPRTCGWACRRRTSRGTVVRRYRQPAPPRPAGTSGSDAHRQSNCSLPAQRCSGL